MVYKKTIPVISQKPLSRILKKIIKTKPYEDIPVEFIVTDADILSIKKFCRNTLCISGIITGCFEYNNRTYPYIFDFLEDVILPNTIGVIIFISIYDNNESIEVLEMIKELKRCDDYKELVMSSYIPYKSPTCNLCRKYMKSFIYIKYVLLGYISIH